VHEPKPINKPSTFHMKFSLVQTQLSAFISNEFSSD